ncbi:MAG: hypothetical protein CVV33_01605 [Methanomicrobiales archaeon HGW-Methanomicrobiales-4]|nr:MAG: hypothetical protein CVV33_01605 [Methanomicrobiales archaeon HGW-Methanomicrobiales-4]
MGIGDNLSDSFGYAQEALVGKWMRWIVLIISTIIFPLIYGYTLRVMKGINPAPEAENFLDLFIDGIKMIVISFVYMIIPFIIFFASAGAAVIGLIGKNDSISLGMLGAAAGGMLIFIIVAFIFGLFATIGMIRFARTDSMGEAFNISEIMAIIARIGWLNYILALIVLWIVLCVIQVILSVIPIIGWVILFIISPFLAIVSSRYFSNLYDLGTV